MWILNIELVIVYLTCKNEISMIIKMLAVYPSADTLTVFPGIQVDHQVNRRHLSRLPRRSEWHSKIPYYLQNVTIFFAQHCCVCRFHQANFFGYLWVYNYLSFYGIHSLPTLVYVKFLVWVG